MSTATQRWPRAEAQRMADKVVTALRSYCERIEIAGSLRRGCTEIGDIDIVLEPRVDCRWGIDERCERHGHRITNGPQSARYVLANGMQLDLWFTRIPPPDLFSDVRPNWGMRLLVATGSREHNVMLAARAKAMGMHFAPYQGILKDGRYEDRPGAEGHPVEHYVGGQVVACETEEKIFKVLDLEYVPPECRGGGLSAESRGAGLAGSGGQTG